MATRSRKLVPQRGCRVEYGFMFSMVSSFSSSYVKIALCSILEDPSHVFPETDSDQIREKQEQSNGSGNEIKGQSGVFEKQLGYEHGKVHEQSQTDHERHEHAYGHGNGFLAAIFFLGFFFFWHCDFGGAHKRLITDFQGLVQINGAPYHGECVEFVLFYKGYEREPFDHHFAALLAHSPGDFLLAAHHDPLDDGLAADLVLF